jgi:hypothetical protein
VSKNCGKVSGEGPFLALAAFGINVGGAGVRAPARMKFAPDALVA